ncbi:unnamed protein product, partial [Prorocentrum cordatum]
AEAKSWTTISEVIWFARVAEPVFNAVAAHLGQLQDHIPLLSIIPQVPPAPVVSFLDARVPAGSATKGKVVKLALVFDQGDDGEVKVAENDLYERWFSNYQMQMLAVPPEDAEPSIEQLTALQRRVKDRGCSPYADFAAWRPLPRKGARADKFRAWFPTGDGSYTDKELPGPENLQQWEASRRVFAAACLMIMAVARPALELHAEKIRQLVQLWAECWHLTVTADDQMRAEHLRRVRRKYEAELQAGQTPAPDWDSERPRSTIYRLAAADEAFWDSRVRHRAAAWVSRGGRGVLRATEEEAAVAHLPGGLAAVAPPTEQPSNPTKRRKTKAEKKAARSGQPQQQPSGNGGPPPAAPRASAGGPRTTEIQICKTWNQGNPKNECGKLGAPSTCPQGRVHKCSTCGDPSHKAPSSALIRVGHWGDALVRQLPGHAGAPAGHPAAPPHLAELAHPAPAAAAPASQRARRELENALCVGGLRCTAAAVARLPRLCALGKEVAALYDRWISERPGAFAVVQRFGDRTYAGPERELVEEWRARLRGHLGARAEAPAGPELLHSRLQAVGDLETCLRDWCQTGAPLRVEVPIPICGIFPVLPQSDIEHHDGGLDMALAQGVFNYQSMADDPEAAASEVHRYFANDVAVSITESTALQRFPGVSVSKIALLTRVKPDATVKRRTIVDLKRSKPVPVNSRARVPERPVLPRICDVIQDARALACGAAPPTHGDESCDMEFAIADFSDARMHLRTHPDELRHCLSPDVVPGLVQSCVNQSHARMQLYLDDPIWTLSGTRAQRDRQLGLALWILIGLGVRIAWHKAARGPAVAWIGATIAADVASREMTVAIPASTIEELLALLVRLGNGATISLKVFKQCIGEHSWVAGLLPRIRCAVAILYAVAASAERDFRSGAEGRRRQQRGDPRPMCGMVAAKRVAFPARWLTALWRGMEGPVTRRIAWGSSPPATVIIVDASPRGLGLTLAHAATGRVVEYAFGDVLDDDISLLLIRRGCSSAQQALEALALLVALKLWGRFLRASSATVDMRGGNSAALAPARKLSSSSPVMNFVGAELALELESLDIRDLCLTHIPGDWNRTADWLSRMSAPGRLPETPAALAGA